MEVGEPRLGEITWEGPPHLSCKRDQIKMRDYMDRRVTLPKTELVSLWMLNFEQFILMTICTHRVLSPSCNCKVPSEVKQLKLWVDLFATYTYSCRICPLECFIVFRPKNSKKNSSWQIWLLYVYVANYSTLYIMDRAWSYHNWLISTESCVNCLQNKHNI